MVNNHKELETRINQRNKNLLAHYKRLADLEREEKTIFAEHKILWKKTEKALDPRLEFNRWRQSKRGRQWKEDQYKRQHGCCAKCKDNIQLKNMHIHHTLPISRLGTYANKPKYYKLLCPACNCEIGNKLDTSCM